MFIVFNPRMQNPQKKTNFLKKQPRQLPQKLKFDAAKPARRIKFKSKFTLLFIAFYKFADPCDTLSDTLQIGRKRQPKISVHTKTNARHHGDLGLF